MGILGGVIIERDRWDGGRIMPLWWVWRMCGIMGGLGGAVELGVEIGMGAIFTGVLLTG